MFWWLLYYCDGLIGDDNIFRGEGSKGFLPVYWWRDDTKDILQAVGIVCSCSVIAATGLFAREIFYCYFFNKILAKCKTDFVLCKVGFPPGGWMAWAWITLSVHVFLGLNIFFTTHGLFYWEEILLDFNSYFKVVMEYIFMHLAKDLFSFSLIHQYVLHGEWFNFWHHVHHQFRECTNTFTTLVFHPADLMIENTAGPFIWLFVKFCILSAYYGEVVYPQVHYAAFLLQTITDSIVHSANPYSPVFFNPILDWTFLTTICHNLHHLGKDQRDAFGRGYYTQWAWHHIDSDARRQDVENYNKVFETNICFEDSPLEVWRKTKERVSRISRRFSKKSGELDTKEMAKMKNMYDEQNKDSIQKVQEKTAIIDNRIEAIDKEERL